MNAVPPVGRLRLFVALAVAPSIVDHVRRVQEQWRHSLRTDCVRWTRPDQLHVTLRFLGGVPSCRVNDIRTALQHAVVGVPAFHLHLEGAGGFPAGRHPRVLWLGVAGELDLLRTLQRRVEEFVGGFADAVAKGSFSPHLTIGRIRSHDAECGEAFESLFRGAVAQSPGWRVAAVDLMQSDLSPGGSRHTRLATVELWG